MHEEVITLALVLSTVATLGLGTVIPATQVLVSRAEESVSVDLRANGPPPGGESAAAGAATAGEATTR